MMITTAHLQTGRLAMNESTDLLDLATGLADIARTTTDVVTGRRLMALVDRLLTEAGLPADRGGSDLPHRWPA